MQHIISPFASLFRCSFGAQGDSAFPLPLNSWESFATSSCGRVSFLPAHWLRGLGGIFKIGELKRSFILFPLFFVWFSCEQAVNRGGLGFSVFDNPPAPLVRSLQMSDAKMNQWCFYNFMFHYNFNQPRNDVWIYNERLLVINDFRNYRSERKPTLWSGFGSTDFVAPFFLKSLCGSTD